MGVIVVPAGAVAVTVRLKSAGPKGPEFVTTVSTTKSTSVFTGIAGLIGRCVIGPRIQPITSPVSGAMIGVLIVPT